MGAAKRSEGEGAGMSDEAKALAESLWHETEGESFNKMVDLISVHDRALIAKTRRECHDALCLCDLLGDICGAWPIRRLIDQDASEHTGGG